MAACHPVETYADRLFSTGSHLSYIPVLAGVSLGAPLIAGDLESSTAELVTSQSVTECGGSSCLHIDTFGRLPYRHSCRGPDARGGGRAG
ncbi:hypothetical protein [Streptomyces pratensis]|uniref:hypothetical protein n=1 Tax=Streptomyces pratensis TaxID=1169025 RepID=UPI0036319721